MLGFLKQTIKISFVLIGVFSIHSVSLAQGYITDSVSSINLGFSPLNPSPGDTILATISSDTVDLDLSKTFWYVDGLLKKEITSKSISIKTKTTGEKTIVRAVVETLDGIVKEVTAEIFPSTVDLLIDPMSYSMPFYKGKPFFIKEGSVRIIALPDIKINGVKIPSRDLIFRWSKDDYILGSNSGKGKDSIVINSTIPIRDVSIGLQILDSSGNILTEKSKIITLNDPKILFYENSPLYGILYNKAIVGNYYLGTKEEVKIIAKPFSFSFLKETSKESNFSWYINDFSYIPPSKINEITLRQEGGVGLAYISLGISNNDKINQYVSSDFSVEFGN